MEVDPSWLEKLPEDERPKRRVSRTPPSTRDSTIPVQSGWLVPPLPGEVPPAERDASKPPPLPSTAKPKGKLPPPLPREEDE